MTVDDLNIAFVGCGAMGGALLKANIDAGSPPKSFSALVRSEDSAMKIAEQYWIDTGVEPEQLLANRDVIVIAVKPDTVPKVLSDIKPYLTEDMTILSVAAGVRCESIEEIVGDIPVVRAMPNLGAMVGKSSTSISPGKNATEKDLEKARRFLKAAGTVVELPEDKINAVIGVSGSGIAWFLTALEAVADAGVALGLSYSDALDLATETMAASATLVKERDTDPGVLRKQVCSPGGTTIAGILAGEEKGFRSAVQKMVIAAHDRAQELQ